MTCRTEQLYNAEPYESKFTAKVSDIVKTGDKYAIILDRTLFFPESGGQAPDKGVLNMSGKIYEVIDVQIKNDIIYHYIDNNDDTDIIAKKCEVKGEIEFAYRFSNMQQHSAEHIFSGLAKRYYNCTNVGFHLSDNEVTFDYDIPLSKEQILKLETDTNRVIYENRTIRAYYPTRDELLNADYRSKKEIEGAIRLVEIEGIDLCACCAPHVRHTGEIGICKVVDTMNYKGGIRISILCGYRALEYYRELDNITSDISIRLSAKREELSEEVDRIVGEKQEIKSKYIYSNRRYLDMLYRHVVNAVDDMRMSDDNYDILAENDNDDILAEHDNDDILSEHIITDDAIILRIDDVDGKSSRDMVNKLKERYPNRLTGVISKSDKGLSYIMGSDNIDCKRVAEYLRDNLGAKGGGSERMIQGNLNRDLTYENVAAIMESVE